MTLKDLNERFGLENALVFEEGAGGLVRAVVDNQHATAEIYLHGGHVTRFRPHGSDEVLWLSEQAVYQAGKAIRGGIPIVWPWFGPHPSSPDQPQHGYARTAAWDVVGTEQEVNNTTRLQLRLRPQPATQPSGQLDLIITVGSSLELDLTTRNLSNEPFTFGCALHTYLAVGDIDQVTIEGLEGGRYIDKLDEEKRKVQSGAIRIGREVDRVYLNTDTTCTVVDPSLRREIRVAKGGSLTTVIWNPWAEKAASMGDFPDVAFRQMVCVETANTADDVRTLAPGEAHTLWAAISVDSL